MAKLAKHHKSLAALDYLNDQELVGYLHGRLGHVKRGLENLKTNAIAFSEISQSEMLLREVMFIQRIVLDIRCPVTRQECAMVASDALALCIADFKEFAEGIGGFSREEEEIFQANIIECRARIADHFASNLPPSRALH